MCIKKKSRDLLRPVFHLAMRPRVNKLCKSTQNRLWKYKDKYNGKECVIVANGPSLTPDDLDKLNKFMTFGVNRIYVMFDKTMWRPDFYICQDATIVRSCKSEIESFIGNKSEIFINPTGQKRYDISNAIYYSLNRKKTKKHIRPNFGIEGKYTFSNGFVTYTAIQLAVFMGFNKIYLIGADHYYSKNDNAICKESYPDPRMYAPDKVGQNPDIDYNTQIYIVAKQYCEEHGIKIYNATRGGKLEVFKRVQLDKILQD